MNTIKRFLSPQVLRYLAVGALNTLFGYSCFALLLYVGLHYSLAALLATVLGVLFNFKSFGSLAFRSNGNHSFVRFVGVYVILYFLNVAGLALLAAQGVAPHIGGAALILPMAAIGYFLHKRFVFHHA